jgi:hypothetical protein
MATTKQAVQELKAERVQEEMVLVGDEPFRILLKAERVQQPSALAAGPEAQWSTAFELDLMLNRQQPVKLELTTFGATITI